MERHAQRLCAFLVNTSCNWLAGRVMRGRVLLIAEFAEQLGQAQHNQRVPRLLLLVLMQPLALFVHASFECLELIREPPISRVHVFPLLSKAEP
jgi:hypothetical protein